MTEKLVLTTPIPGTADRTNYKIIQVNLNWAEDAPHAFLKVRLEGDDETFKSVELSSGEQARTDMRALNKANLTTSSMHKRIMQKLIADGHLEGTISGTPD